MSKTVPRLARAFSHDYRLLVKRWRAVARAARMDFAAFVKVDDCPVYCLLPRRAEPARMAMYLSAGIHGDEPASTEGLIEWAERSVDILRQRRTVIFPCLNPWGLMNNSRVDLRGRDLNRCYRGSRAEPVVAQKRLLRGWKFDCAACLHEDYDAHGVYVYEADGGGPYIGERVLAVASRHLPIETRTVVEGSPCHNGLVRRSIPPELLDTLPEAIYLHLNHARRTITLETPSEYHLDDRVAVHMAVLDELVRLAV